jgi:[ribosomal protein S5]-alanine N-acetyltransferase
MNNDNFLLCGEKVRLRKFTETDITDRYIAWLNDAEVVRFSNQRFIRHDHSSCLRYFQSFKESDNFFVSICRLDDGSPIGTLTAYISTQHQTVDVGILLGDKSVWAQGYGQEAWNLMTHWLLYDRGGLRKLTAGTLACNYGMIKLMERSGMKLEAIRYRQEIVDDCPTDIVYYSRFYED